MQEKYIPYLSYIDICRVLCDKTNSPAIKNKLGYETFIPPMECFYSRSFITEEVFDLNAIAQDLTQKIQNESYPKLLSFFTNDAPINYEEILTAAGFKPGFHQAAMVGNLDCLADFPTPEGEAKLISAEELEEWKTTMTVGFGKSEAPAMGLYESLFSIENVKIYGWFIDGKIVGTMMAVKNGDITGLHEGAVLPEHRKKGIITALILKGAADFLPEGIKKASMQASAMGGPVYAKLGFKETGFIDTWIYQG